MRLLRTFRLRFRILFLSLLEGDSWNPDPKCFIYLGVPDRIRIRPKVSYRSRLVYVCTRRSATLPLNAVLSLWFRNRNPNLVDNDGPRWILIQWVLIRSTVAEFIDPVFMKRSPKRLFSVNQYERFVLVFAKTGCLISGTGVIVRWWLNLRGTLLLFTLHAEISFI
jgi:hypothetical protein